MGFPGSSVGKESACNAGDLGLIPGSIPWRKAWQRIPVFLPGDSHGQRSLAGYTVHGVAKVRHDLTIKPPPYIHTQAQTHTHTLTHTHRWNLFLTAFCWTKSLIPLNEQK